MGQFLNCVYGSLRIGLLTIQELSKAQCNYTDNNNNDYSDTDPDPFLSDLKNMMRLENTIFLSDFSNDNTMNNSILITTKKYLMFIKKYLIDINGYCIILFMEVIPNEYKLQ